MHLSVDSIRPLADIRAALPDALARQGLRIERVRTTPAGGFVAELSDPLPALDAEPPGRATGVTYAVAGFAREGGGSRLSAMDPVALVLGMDRPLAEGPARILGRALVAAMLAAAGREDEIPAAGTTTTSS